MGEQQREKIQTDLLRALPPMGTSGVRISELRSKQGLNIEAVTLQTQLEALQSQGWAARDLTGRWNLTILGKAQQTSRIPVQSPGKPSPVPLAPGSKSAVAHPPSSAKSAQKSLLPDVPDPGFTLQHLDGGRYVDPSQEEIIRAPIDACQIVEAGPGFGKTYTACARVAWLIAQGVADSRILLLSFTRTAVREMRSRISALSASGTSTGGVEIRTLDSLTWRLRNGFAQTSPRGFSTHDDNIQQLLEMLQKPPAEMLEYIQQFEHVFVDEAQDLVGARAGLVLQLMELLPASSGYTLFLDPAQAIYDWSEQSPTSVPESVRFLDFLQRLTRSPHYRALSTLHRTKDAELRRLLLGARKLVLDDHSKDRAKILHTALQQRIHASPSKAHEVAKEISNLGEAARDTLHLYRRRAECIELVSYLANEQIPFRLRYGNLPPLIAPWLAVLINRAYESVQLPLLSRTALKQAWDDISNPWLKAGWSFEQAWKVLRQLGPDKSKERIHLEKLATSLAQRKLPDDLSNREIGQDGPIIGTVHGSKGQEAHTVYLNLWDPEDDDAAAEARVLYVGLSRAKEALVVRGVRGKRWSYLDSGRVWRNTDEGAYQLEVGREGDLDALESMRYIDKGAADWQTRLAAFDGKCQKLKMRASSETGWRRLIGLDENVLLHPLARLSRSCEEDLAIIAKRASPSAKAPTWLTHIRWLDLTTVAVAADCPGLSELPFPYRETRIWLMPVVGGVGYGKG